MEVIGINDERHLKRCQPETSEVAPSLLHYAAFAVFGATFTKAAFFTARLVTAFACAFLAAPQRFH